MDMKRMIAVCLLLAVNVLSFLLMGADKRRAREGRRRIRERTLLLVAACFGALGGTLGMFFFHHKTRKPASRWVCRSRC